MKSFKHWVCAAGVLLLAGWPACSPQADRADGDERPNILFVLLDDIRFDDLGFTGHPFVRTPNIDRIAREGIEFTNAFAATPLCSPNRASILTGLYAHRHGIIDNVDRSAQSHALTTFPLLLQQAGYETAFIGKWHMGIDDTRRPGFDEWLSIKGQGNYFDPEVNDNGVNRKLEGYATDVFSARTAELIRRKRDKPFLIYLSHKAVHPNITQNADGSIDSIPADGGFKPPERLQSLYADETITRRPNASSYGEGKPALLRPIEGLPKLGPETATPDDVILNRLRMLTAADEGFGIILKALEQTGQLDNTLIVVTSDHGYFYGEHGLNEERRLAYEEIARIPLAARLPGMIAAGSKADPFVLSVDLAPTFLEIGGGQSPEKLDGRSLAPLLRGETPDDWRRTVLIEYFSDTVWPRLVKMGYQAVRTERWKLIRYVDLEGMDELYDLEADPYEMHNLIKDESARETLQQLEAELDRLLAETGAGGG
jgi:N-acetylglucosamine-6-sulfatase